MFKIFLKKFWPVFLIISFSGILLTENLNKPFIGYHDWNSVVYARSAKTLIGKSELPGIYFQSHYPPLLPIFLAGSFLIFGVHDWAARIVPVMTMTGTAIVIYFLGTKLWSKKEGILAAIFFLFTPLIRYFAKIPVHETILPLFIILSFYFYWLWYKTKKIKYYWFLLIILILAEFTGWPGYYPVIWITIHYLLFEKEKKYNLILNWWLLSLVNFALFLLMNFYLTGPSFLQDLLYIFKFRANIGQQSISFSWQEFISQELLWMRVYFTRILSFLTVLWIGMTFWVSFKQRKINHKVFFLFFLALSGFIHLLFFVLVWFHDYMIIYLTPFVVLVSARVLVRLGQKISFHYCFLGILVILIMFFESKNFLRALEETHDFYPAYLLGEKIKKISEPDEQFFIGSEEGGKMYGVYLDYYADRIHNLGEPSYNEFLLNENQYKDSFRYFITDESHNYLSGDLVKYLLSKYSWQQTGQFKIFDLKK